MEDYFKNSPFSSIEHFSPSGKYKLVIDAFTTSNAGAKFTMRNKTRGTLYNAITNEYITKVERDHHYFPFLFFQKSDKEYLFCGSHRWSTTIIHCDTKEKYVVRSNLQIYSYHQLDKSTIYIDGGYGYGADYEYQFYDFTEPFQKLKPLPLSNDVKRDYLSIVTPSFIEDATEVIVEDGIFIIKQYEWDYDQDYNEIDGTRYKKLELKLKRKGNEMKLIDIEKCNLLKEEETEQEKQDEILFEKQKELRQSNSFYQYLISLLRKTFESKRIRESMEKENTVFDITVQFGHISSACIRFPNEQTPQINFKFYHWRENKYSTQDIIFSVDSIPEMIQMMEELLNIY